MARLSAVKPGYWRVLARMLKKHPQHRSRAEWWAFRSTLAIPSHFLIFPEYWFPGGPFAAIAAAAACFVLIPFLGAWWLHKGRDRHPLSAIAVERNQARADRKQRRHERRVEKWRVTRSM